MKHFFDSLEGKKTIIEYEKDYKVAFSQRKLMKRRKSVNKIRQLYKSDDSIISLPRPNNYNSMG